MAAYLKLPHSLRNPLYALTALLSTHCGLIAESTYRRAREVADVQAVGDIGSTDAEQVLDAVSDDQPDPTDRFDSMDVADVRDGGTRADAALDVKDASNIVDAGPPLGPCGNAPPANEAMCEIEGLICEYGDDPRAPCRPAARCAMSRWEVIAPMQCPAFNAPPVCPPSAMDANGQGCPREGQWCGYAGLTCHCTGCVSFPQSMCGLPLVWRCDGPNLSPSCPNQPPLLGTACVMDQLSCSYSCETHGDLHHRVCLGGLWTLARAQCARSSRAAKRDFVYLNAADVDSVAQRMLQTPLALHQQRFQSGLLDPSLSRLAPRPDFSTIDLYGYTSLVLATVQSQHRALEQLQQDVQRLQTAQAQRTQRAPRAPRAQRPHRTHR